MKHLNTIVRRTASALSAALIVIVLLSAARAQTVTPQVTCVAPNPNDTATYFAYFGYTNTGSEPVYIPAGSSDNYFEPIVDPDGAPFYFYPGIHRKFFRVIVPRTISEAWYLNGVEAAAAFQSGLLCGGNITYQGRLSVSGAAANGSFDLHFQAFDALTGGAAQSDAQTISNVQISNGIFTVALDGDLLFPREQTGKSFYLEIAVKQGSANFTTLAPRQPITATPFAVNAITANDASQLGGVPANQYVKTTGNSTTINGNTQITGDGGIGSNLIVTKNATVGGSLTVSGAIIGTVSKATNADNLGNVAANQYVLTTDARLSATNNTSFIQNSTTQQTANFNVSGNGTLGGSLTTNTFNASSANNMILNAGSSSPTGTWLTLNNTTTGGRKWSVISTGAANGEGAGKLLFYDQTNSIGRLLLSDAGASITGNLTVSGSISGATKNFKIDHPLDPLNKTLTYTAIESPDMMNIYNGNITTNENGEAIVTMPNYFEALNKDFRYQLTVIGQFAQVIVLEKIKGNQFKIKTDKPNVEVSWQVTGIRHDKFAEDRQTNVEENKPAADKGRCLYAPACGGKEQKR